MSSRYNELSDKLNWEKVYNEYISGFSTTDLAKKYKCSTCGIIKNFRKRGYKLRTRTEGVKLACTGEKNRHWNGGEVKNGKYVYICIGNGLYRPRSHIVWEKYHNTKIPPNYVIHHIDYNEANDDITNLQLLSWSKHASLHNKQFITTKKRICKYCGIAFTGHTRNQVYCTQKCNRMYWNGKKKNKH